MVQRDISGDTPGHLNGAQSPTLATDNDLNTYWHSNNQVGDYFTLTFAANVAVAQITIKPRTDCCAGRYDGWVIRAYSGTDVTDATAEVWSSGVIVPTSSFPTEMVVPVSSVTMRALKITAGTLTSWHFAEIYIHTCP